MRDRFEPQSGLKSRLTALQKPQISQDVRAVNAENHRINTTVATDSITADQKLNWSITKK